MRTFPYVTTGKILETLEKEGCKISRITFRRLEEQGLFMSKRTTGGWRVYTAADAAIIIQLILENYGKRVKNQ